MSAWMSWRNFRGARWAVACLGALALTTMIGRGDPTIHQEIDPTEVNVGDEVTVTITVQNGSIGDIHLPAVDGLQLEPGMSTSTNITFTNGAFTSAVSEMFRLVPNRAGDFTIPAFNVPLRGGGSLRAQAMKLHVVASGANQANPAPAGPQNNVVGPGNPFGNIPNAPVIPPVFNPNGPVVQPPNNGTQPGAPDTAASEIDVPTDPDGRPAKVFMVITPKTTDAYVGQSVPVRIEWYLREDVAYGQDSLPTVKGRDFMMSNLSEHPNEDELILKNEQYLRNTWTTAILAPRSGDFPLQMERDSYWIKSNPANSNDLLNMLLHRQANLAHGSIPSNSLVMHVHPLPEEGQPKNFTGAIGQFTATATATPESVGVGDPVTIHFTISGEGNFDYVHCPDLASDPAWKTYVPTSKTTFVDESKTQGAKIFEQAAIPQKAGTLPMPQATFSYFDPTTKHYVTTPIDLPLVTVTGAPPAATPTAPGVSPESNPTPAPPKANDFIANRDDAGALHRSLVPAYREPWFWGVQAGLIALPVAGAIFLLIAARPGKDDGKSELLRHLDSLHREEDAMAEAVRRDDASAFFLAARRSVQLQLGKRWRIKPEAVTLDEIQERDPQLAEAMQPFFTQADELAYSGQINGDLDLAQWDAQVRELLQPQTAAA